MTPFFQIQQLKIETPKTLSKYCGLWCNKWL